MTRFFASTRFARSKNFVSKIFVGGEKIVWSDSRNRWEVESAALDEEGHNTDDARSGDSCINDDDDDGNNDNDDAVDGDCQSVKLAVDVGGVSTEQR